MPRLFHILILLTLPFWASGQTWTVLSEDTLDGDALDWPNEVLPDRGGWIAAGYTNSVAGMGSPQGQWDGFLSRRGGSLPDWSLRLGGTGIDAFTAMVPHGAGWAVSGYRTHPAGHTDIWLVAVDSLGNVLWERTWGGSGQEEAFGLVALPDGSLLMGGFTNSADGDIARTGTDMDGFLAHVDAAGGMLNMQFYGSPAADDWITGLAPCGASQVCAPGFRADPDPQLWLLRLDTAGAVVDSLLVGGASPAVGVAAAGNDSLAWAAGYRGDALGPVQAGQNAWVGMADASGWRLSRPQGQFGDNAFYSLCPASGGGVYVGGWTHDPNCADGTGPCPTAATLSQLTVSGERTELWRDPVGTGRVMSIMERDADHLWIAVVTDLAVGDTRWRILLLERP